jgi:hypothetical protein
MEALRKLAESGINFCQGLTIEPYGSFTSGMWTRHGDLDISIESSAEWLDEYTKGNRNGGGGRGGEGRGGHTTRGSYATTRQVDVLNMSQNEKKKFLRAFANRLRDRVACPQNFLVLIGEKIRVPIIKFVSKVGQVECDVSCDGHKALFKSTIMGLLSHHDWRFGTMVRLVKLWARKWELNDPTTGTFNSFSLSLMVLFYFQNRSPAIFPPLKELFAGEDRPMQDANGGGDNNNRPLEKEKMTRLVQLANDKLHQLSALKQQGNNNSKNNSRDVNSETLVELLSGFFAFYSGIFSAWISPEDEYETTAWKAYKLPNPDTNRKLSRQLEEVGLARVARHARTNTWDGSLTTQPWPPTNGALFSIEDPFNSTDNCCRTIRRWDTANTVLKAFRAAATQLQILTDTMDVVLCLDTLFSEADVDIPRLFDNEVQKRAVKAIQPVDLMLPGYVREAIGKTPPCVVADHTVARSREIEEEEEGKGWDDMRSVLVSNMSMELGAEIKAWAEGKLEVHRSREEEREKSRRAKEVKRAKRKTEKDARKTAAKAAASVAAAKAAASVVSQARQLVVAAAQMTLHGNGNGGGTTVATAVASTTVVGTLTVINNSNGGGRFVSRSSSSDEEMEENEIPQIHPKRLAFLERQAKREAAANAAAAQAYARSRVLAGRYHGNKKTNI